MFSIANNLLARNTNRQLVINNKNKLKSMEKLSTGYRLNRSADDAAGLCISEKMRAQIRGLNQASKNVQDGISFCQVADGAASEIHNILHRMNELTLSAANETKTDDDRFIIQEEMDQLRTEINKICIDTNFNGIKMFNSINVPIPEGQPKDIKIFNIDTNTYGGIIFNGNRYTWNDIHPNMINESGAFIPGTYSFKTDDGVQLELIANNGTEPPKLLRQYSLTADENGITMDNETFSWSSMGLDLNNIMAGTYTFSYKGSDISFQVEGGTDATTLISSINQDNLKAYQWNSVYDSTSVRQAVDLNYINPIVITNSNKDYISTEVPPYTLRADRDGVWMEATNGKAVNPVYTKMSWKDLGIDSWTSGNTIDPTKTYIYTDNNTGLSIGFRMPYEEAGIDEVINGLDGSYIYAQLATDTGMTMFYEGSQTGTTVSGNLTAHIKFEDLRAMGTDLDANNWISGSASMGFSGNTYSYDIITGGVGTHYECGDDLNLTFGSGSDTVTFTKNNLYDTLVNSLLNWKYFYEHGNLVTPNCTYNFNLNSANGSTINATFGFNTDEIASTNLSDVENYVTKFLSDLQNHNTTKINSYIKPYYRNYGLAVDLSGNRVNITNYAHYIKPIPRTMNIQVSGKSRDNLAIELKPLNSTIMGLSSVDVTTMEKAQNLIDNISGAVDYVSGIRSHYGALQNRMEYIHTINENTAEETQKAEAAIRDTDIEMETVALARSNILEQVGQAMLAQSNHSRDGVLQLLR
jgi:flagellin-like hook-associated protein FlgL